MKYESTALFVSNIEKSKQFYRDIIGLDIMMDNVIHVAFISGLNIWDSASAYNVIFNKENEASHGHKMELCFASENIQKDYEKISQTETEIINPLFEQPWSQLAFRVYDPDGNIVEIAESIQDTFRRLLDDGLTMAQVSERTHTSESDIKKMLNI